MYIVPLRWLVPLYPMPSNASISILILVVQLLVPYLAREDVMGVAYVALATPFFIYVCVYAVAVAPQNCVN